jgi:hypothetical protein
MSKEGQHRKVKKIRVKSQLHNRGKISDLPNFHVIFIHSAGQNQSGVQVDYNVVHL